MVEYSHSDEEAGLSGILKAVSDATRRSLLTRLCQDGPTRVTDLAGQYDMSLNAISKHIKVLENADLVQRKTVGRTHWIEADLARVNLVEQWFTELRSIWAMRLDTLNDILTNPPGETDHE